MSDDNSKGQNDNPKHYPIVGRNSAIDLSKYTVLVHGRDVIDYEKLKHDDPALYQKILKQEHEYDRLDSIKNDGMFS